MLRQKIKRWNNVSGAFEKEMDRGELRIYFESSGYHDPGEITAHPETSRHPESEDIRTPSFAVYEYYEDSSVHAMPQDVCEFLFEYYREEIQQVEINKEQDYE